MRLYKVTQLLELARKLAASAEGYTLDEIAGAMKVNRRTAERLRNAIQHVFPQLDERTDGRQKRFFIPGGLERLFVTPELQELVELDHAAQALDNAGAGVRAASLRSLAAKIRGSQRRASLMRLEPDLEALSLAEIPVRKVGIRPIVNEEHLGAIRQAILEGRRLRLHYRTGDGRQSVRRIEPYGLLWGNSYMLVGPEEGQTKIKHWRLDRMTDVAADSVCEGPPADFSLRDYAENMFGTFHEDPEDVVIRFDADVAGHARQFHFHESQTFEDLDDGRLELRFRAGGLLEVARHVFSWGGTAEVVAPDRLKDVLRAELTAVAGRLGA